VIGTNGSGKSTLLNAVAGSFFVDRGAITIAGKDVTRWPEHRRAAMIGRVFQNPFSGTAPAMTVAENLALAPAAVSATDWAAVACTRAERAARSRSHAEHATGNAHA